MAIKLTLLQLCQDMLAAVDAENVNAVNETAEAEMCVNIANRAFEGMIGPKYRWKHLRQSVNLSTTALLNEMTLPTGTIAFDPYSLYYSGKLLTWVEPDEFIWRTESRVVDGTSVVLKGDNKIDVGDDPIFFTSYDDSTLVFESIPDNTTGLVSANTHGIAFVAPTARLTDDTDVFDLPAVAFPALSTRCVGLAIRELKGDHNTAASYDRDYRSMMAALSRNRRVMEARNDSRKWIVPRRTHYRS